jgi:hypothetical protein
MSQELQLNTQTKEVAKKIDEVVKYVFENRATSGFEKAFVDAYAIETITNLLTQEYIDKIKFLQNKKIGFLTDSTTGYQEDTLKNCIVEALMSGLEITGNQFNIISAKVYDTQEGYTHLLKTRVPDLKEYDINYSIPKLEDGKTVVETEIEWILQNGTIFKKTKKFPIKVNANMGTDAILGKAERKAKKWLYEKLTGVITRDGDIQDIPHTVVSSNTKNSDNSNVVDIEEIDESPKQKTPEEERADKYFDKATSKEDLENRKNQITSSAGFENIDLTFYYEKMKSFG